MTIPVPASLTPDHIESVIVGTNFHPLPKTQVTICELTLVNGTKVLGYNYGSIDPARQNWTMGQENAEAMAREKVWELEGYLLRQRIHEANKDQAK